MSDLDDLQSLLHRGGDWISLPRERVASMADELARLRDAVAGYEANECVPRSDYEASVASYGVLREERDALKAALRRITQEYCGCPASDAGHYETCAVSIARAALEGGE